MKGSEIINHIVREKMPDREQVRENCKRQSQPQPQSIPEERGNRRPVFRPAIATATVAVLIIGFIMVNMWLSSHSDNSFSLKAYALEHQADGSISLRDYEMTDEYTTTMVCIMADDGYFYTSLYLEIEGENIKDVQLHADGDGEFMISYDLMENGKWDMSIYNEVYDENGAFLGYGSKLETMSTQRLGNSVTFDAGGMPEDAVLFVGKPSIDDAAFPLGITIRAVATFNNGTTREKTLRI